MRICRYRDLDSGIWHRPQEEASPAAERIVRDVRARGDEALHEYTRLLDGTELETFRIPSKEIQRAREALPAELRGHLRRAAENLRRFARAQLAQLAEFDCPIEPGVEAGQRIVPIRRIGVYVPGGRYPLVSSLLMGAVPAFVAGVEEIAVCSPPGADGSLPDEMLAAAGEAGVGEVYRLGGAQAVAAMAYGTESIPPVDKIVGPGNRYVTAAKRIVFGRVGIDFPAGPTEILIIADRDADPVLIAADLLAQAEHDCDARPVLVTDETDLASRVRAELQKRLRGWPDGHPARISLKENGLTVLVDSPAEAIAFANRMAPEHLELMVSDPAPWRDGLRNYGTLFIGPMSAEVLGDYSSGLNHILPTGGAARYRGGLGVRDFVKIQTVLKVTEAGLDRIGPVAEALAEIEGLTGHVQAARVRRTRMEGQ